MRPVLSIAAIALAVPTSGTAQDLAATYATRGAIAETAAKAAAVKPGHGTASLPLMALGDVTAKVEYHVGPNIANAHPGQAELFQAIEGSGTLVTGGSIVRTTTGAMIRGGTARHVAAGDIFIVPEGLPHWYSQVDGHLVMVSVMIPRTVAK